MEEIGPSSNYWVKRVMRDIPRPRAGICRPLLSLNEVVTIVTILYSSALRNHVESNGLYVREYSVVRYKVVGRQASQFLRPFNNL